MEAGLQNKQSPEEFFAEHLKTQRLNDSDDQKEGGEGDDAAQIEKFKKEHEAELNQAHTNIDEGKLGKSDIEALVFNTFNSKAPVSLGIRGKLPMLLDFKKIPYVNSLPFFSPIMNTIIRHILKDRTKKTTVKQEE